jgi:hypothetical protein
MELVAPYNVLYPNDSDQIVKSENKEKEKYVNPTKQLVNNYWDLNRSMYDNRGKYFDSYLFNAKFDEYIKEQQKKRLLKQEVQLRDLNNVENIKIHPYQLPLNKIMINLKDSWFNVFDNISKNKPPLTNVSNDDLFYFGVTLLAIYLIYTMLSFIFD